MMMAMMMMIMMMMTTTIIKMVSEDRIKRVRVRIVLTRADFLLLL